MFFPRKSPNSSKTGKLFKSVKAGTPLDRRQQALREAEEKLRQDQARLERLILEAPQKREETSRRRREQLSSDPRLSRSAPMDKHVYHATANPAFGHRKLRSEKREGLYLFLFLIAVLASIVFWICHLLL